MQQLVAHYPSLQTQMYDGDKNLHKHINIYVDDEDFRYTGGLETAVPDGALVSLLPAVAGGTANQS